MKLRLTASLLFFLSILILSACASPGSQATDMIEAQPPISIAQRKASVLTPTSPASDAEESPQPQPSNEAGPDPTIETTVEPESQTPTWTATQPPITFTATTEPTGTVPPVPTATLPQPTTAPSNTPIPTEAGQAVCTPSSSSAFASEVIQLINQQRAAAGIALLTGQTQLTGAAQDHSSDMACSQFFSHTGPTSGTLFDRLAAAGYSYSWAGENIAAGYTTPAAVVEAWMSSEGHRANILNENFTQIGVGYAAWDGSSYGTYWTAVFASP